jgi:hypothetical protein
MIRTFEYKIPFAVRKSFKVSLDSGNEIPNWDLLVSDEDEGIIEWKKKSLFVFGSPMIRLYLRQQRPTYTLVTVYVNHPYLPIDPFKLCERMYRKLEMKLNQRT